MEAIAREKRRSKKRTVKMRVVLRVTGNAADDFKPVNGATMVA
jgi:hypothetical protein